MNPHQIHVLIGTDFELRLKDATESEAQALRACLAGIISNRKTENQEGKTV